MMWRLLTITLFGVAFCFCSEQSPRNKRPQTDSPLLFDILTYHDSIGDLNSACFRMEAKIDSLYDVMNAQTRQHNREIDSFFIDAKISFRETFDLNAAIYRQTHDNGTAGGSAAALYYYYSLCKYYEEVRALQITLNQHFLELEEMGLDSL